MKIIFGFMSLVIVLAIIGHLSKTQLSVLGLTDSAKTRAVHQGSEAQAVTNAVMGRATVGGAATIAVPGGMPGAEAAVVDTTIAGQSRSVQQNVLQQTNKAIEQGIQRNANAQP
jgi:hypothetical protein